MLNQIAQQVVTIINNNNLLDGVATAQDTTAWDVADINALLLPAVTPVATKRVSLDKTSNIAYHTITVRQGQVGDSFTNKLDNVEQYFFAHRLTVIDNTVVTFVSAQYNSPTRLGTGSATNEGVYDSELLSNSGVYLQSMVLTFQVIEAKNV